MHGYDEHVTMAHEQQHYCDLPISLIFRNILSFLDDLKKFPMMIMIAIDVMATDSLNLSIKKYLTHVEKYSFLTVLVIKQMFL